MNDPITHQTIFWHLSLVSLCFSVFVSEHYEVVDESFPWTYLLAYSKERFFFCSFSICLMYNEIVWLNDVQYISVAKTQKHVEISWKITKLISWIFPKKLKLTFERLGRLTFACVIVPWNCARHAGPAMYTRHEIKLRQAFTCHCTIFHSKREIVANAHTKSKLNNNNYWYVIRIYLVRIQSLQRSTQIYNVFISTHVFEFRMDFQNFGIFDRRIFSHRISVYLILLFENVYATW